MEPFHYIMQANHVNLYLIRKQNLNLELITDWKCYELILFNILQNSIKFNKIEGDIVIIIKINPVKSTINLNDSVNSIDISALMTNANDEE